MEIDSSVWQDYANDSSQKKGKSKPPAGSFFGSPDVNIFPEIQEIVIDQATKTERKMEIIAIIFQFRTDIFFGKNMASLQKLKWLKQDGEFRQQFNMYNYNRFVAYVTSIIKDNICLDKGAVIFDLLKPLPNAGKFFMGLQNKGLLNDELELDLSIRLCGLENQATTSTPPDIKESSKNEKNHSLSSSSSSVDQSLVSSTPGFNNLI